MATNGSKRTSVLPTRVTPLREQVLRSGPRPWQTVLACVLVAFVVASASELAEVLLPGSWLAAPGAGFAWGAGAAVLALLGLRAYTGRQSRRLRQVRALSDLAQRAGQPGDLQDLLDAAMRHALEIAEADAGSVRLLESNGTYVTRASFNTLPGETEGTETLTGAEPLLLTPEAGAARPRVVLPLLADGRLYGVLTLLFGKPRRFGLDELETLHAIASQVGTAVANARTQEKLIHEAQMDDLTGLGSRRHFDLAFRRELARARRTRRPLSLAMIDIDYFKEINDEWGHRVGDQVLEVLGQILRRVRGGDVVARYGGDEFVILMPETTLEEAQMAVERLKEQVERYNAEGNLPFPLQISVGVREMDASDNDLVDLVAEADAAMYQDKQNRRRSDRTVALAAEHLLPRTGTDG